MLPLDVAYIATTRTMNRNKSRMKWYGYCLSFCLFDRDLTFKKVQPELCKVDTRRLRIFSQCIFSIFIILEKKIVLFS